MKLYATITSERATKGQGGNEYIEVVLKDEDQKIQYIINYTQDGIMVRSSKKHLQNNDGGVLVDTMSIEKGNKQKGENCNGTGKHSSVEAIVNCPICKNDPLLN